MNEQIIFQAITYILNNGHIIKTKHAMLRMAERNITDDDIIQILSNPSHIYKEELSETYDNKYNYRVMGIHDYSVVVSIDYPNSLIIVTVID